MPNEEAHPIDQLQRAASSLREHLATVTNVRDSISTAQVVLLYKDIDSLLALALFLAGQPFISRVVVLITKAHYLESVLKGFEVEVALLREECVHGEKTRKVLMQQRAVERHGETALHTVDEILLLLQGKEGGKQV